MKRSTMEEISMPSQTEPNEIPLSGESDYLYPMTEESKQLLKAVVDGQLHEVQKILERKQPEVDINCIDDLGRTPLILAAEKEQVNEQIVQLLVENGADTEGALMHAVIQENTETLKKILSYCSKAREKPDIENQHIKFVSCVSSLMLACKLDNYEMVKLLISHGERVIEHNINCSCDTCLSAESNLSRAIIRLESYRALSSPIYIVAQYIVNHEATESPIYKAFALSKKLRKLASVDYEFKDEYLALSYSLDTFPVALLDECLGMEEAQMVMKTVDPLKIKEYVTEEARNLHVLRLATKNKNEEFIAHPYSQVVLNNEVFRQYPNLRNANWKTKYILSTIAIPFIPVFVLCYIFLPNNHVSNLLRTPLVKYITFICSFLIFLLLLIITAFQPITDFLNFTTIDWLVIVYVIGYCLDTANEIYHNGCNRYLFNWYNYVFVAMITSFVFYYAIFTTGRHFLIARYGSWEAARIKSNAAEFPHLGSFKAVQYSYAFYSAGTLLAFVYLISTVHLHPKLGPLLMSLIGMLREVAHFFYFFLFFFVAFVVCLKKLYLQYDQSYTKFFLASVNGTTWQPQRLASLAGSIKVVFWSLFGKVELSEFNTAENYSIVRSIALNLFAVFNVLAVLVSLNMLIAMLNESFSKDTASNDTKWKYSRTKMLLTMMCRTSVLPPPFNLIPSPRAVMQLFQCIARIFCRREKVR